MSAVGRSGAQPHAAGSPTLPQRLLSTVESQQHIHARNACKMRQVCLRRGRGIPCRLAFGAMEPPPHAPRAGAVMSGFPGPGLDQARTRIGAYHLIGGRRYADSPRGACAFAALDRPSCGPDPTQNRTRPAPRERSPTELHHRPMGKASQGGPSQPNFSLSVHRYCIAPRTPARFCRLRVKPMRIIPGCDCRLRTRSSRPSRL
jgi:hypothetical protein